MKKVIVIGCPGSGKSTFSKTLNKITKLPLYHLDMLYWNADKTKVEKSVFTQRLSDILSKKVWIIDGNYNSTMEQRFQSCDTVIFLDYPRTVCLEGIKQRQGAVRGDIPWVETEENKEFLGFVQDYNTHSRPIVMDLIEKYSDKNIIILQTREDTDKFLAKLKIKQRQTNSDFEL